MITNTYSNDEQLYVCETAIEVQTQIINHESQTTDDSVFQI